MELTNKQPIRVFPRETPPTTSLDTWFVEFSPIARELRDALAQTLESLLGESCRARDIDEAFGIGRAMASRIHRAAFFENEMESASILPGRPTILKLIATSRTKDIEPKVVDQLQQAYSQFTKKIAKVASNQRELTALLRAHDPKTIKNAMLQQRAACFRAEMDFAGIYADSISSLFITWPSDNDPKYGDVVQANAASGLHRYGILHPIRVASHSETTDAPEDSSSCRIDGDPNLMKIDGTLIRSLTSPCIPNPRKIHTHNDVVWSVTGEDLPIGEPVNIVSGVVHTKWAYQVQPDEPGVEQLSSVGLIPCKIRVFDYLIHKDMYKGIEPVLKVYNSAGAVPMDAYPEDWTHCEIPDDSTLTQISASELLRTTNDAPLQALLAQYSIDHLNLDLDDFRIYRLVIRYPILRAPIIVFFTRR